MSTGECLISLFCASSRWRGLVRRLPGLIRRPRTLRWLRLTPREIPSLEAFGTKPRRLKNSRLEVGVRPREYLLVAVVDGMLVLVLVLLLFMVALLLL